MKLEGVAAAMHAPLLPLPWTLAPLPTPAGVVLRLSLPEPALTLLRSSPQASSAGTGE